MRVAIVGNGVAAVTAIREARRIDPSIQIDVWSDERHPYYPRPRLIELIAGRITERDVIQYDEAWYHAQGVGLHLAEPVRSIDISSLTVKTGRGEYPGYDKILIACGSTPAIPPIAGIDGQGIYVIRTLDDALVIRDAINSTRRQIVLGGGILGIEIAAAMSARGGEPLVVSNITQLLPAQLDAAGSEVLIERLERMGVRVQLGYACDRIDAEDGTTRLISQQCGNLEGDMVVVSTGVRPNKALAEAAGIACGRGVRVDSYMMTSVRNIYAAGDCAEWNGVVWGIIPPAMDMSKIAAQNMIQHGSATYNGTVRSNTLQVAGIDLTSIGEISPPPNATGYETVVQREPADGTYFKVVIKDNMIVGAIILGSRQVALRVRQLINNRTDVSSIRDSIFSP